MTPEQITRGLNHYRTAQELDFKRQQLDTTIGMAANPRSRSYCISLWEEPNGEWLCKTDNQHSVRLALVEGARVLAAMVKTLEQIRDEHEKAVERMTVEP